jgi:hypothetical protein
MDRSQHASRRSELAEAVGPCYTRASFARATGLTDPEITKAVAGLDVLELPTAEGIPIYPEFQVHEGSLTPGMRDLLRILRSGTPRPWTWALWLCATPKRLGHARGVRMIDAFHDGYKDEVLREAARVAAALSA